MRITRFIFLLFVFFIIDNLHYSGLGPNTYKSWSLRNRLNSASKRSSIKFAVAIYKFIKDKTDLSLRFISSFAEIKEFAHQENKQLPAFHGETRMCIMAKMQAC